MQERELGDASPKTAAIIEELARDLGLLEKRLTLARYPGSRHWHYKRKGMRGTLEITWWPGGNRTWASLREDRFGEWIESVIQEMTEHIRVGSPPEV